MLEAFARRSISGPTESITKSTVRAKLPPADCKTVCSAVSLGQSRLHSDEIRKIESAATLKDPPPSMNHPPPSLSFPFPRQEKKKF